MNQFTVEYTNNGQKENRRPDVILFVNGMPLCIMELKNPADANATIYDAWEQINIRYWRDIPHLLHYCPLACISDGVKTRLGTVRTPYEHFYAWRRVNDGDAVSTLPFAETETMIKGVYSPERFLEIFRDYIYFQDSIYDSDEVEIVCRYPQFFAARLLKQSIVNSVVTRSGKGGTYFGATGCGKTYTMAFLARQLALRCTDIPEIGSPTIILIVDRDELQKQGSKLFTKSKEFLNLGEVSVVKNRSDNIGHIELDECNKPALIKIDLTQSNSELKREFMIKWTHCISQVDGITRYLKYMNKKMMRYQRLITNVTDVKELKEIVENIKD